MSKAVFVSNLITNIKPIFHTFLFNINNYSIEISNIQRCQGQLNITLLMMNDRDIKQKMV